MLTIVSVVGCGGQVLHHTATYRSSGCYYIMADRRSKIIADAFVDFTNPDWEEDGDSEEPYHHQIVTSYEHILNWLYEELLEQFLVPGRNC